MLSDTTSDQQNFRRCGQCGAPLAALFSPCPSCHAYPADTFAARAALAPGGHLPPDHRRLPMRVPTLPTRRIWSPSSRALVQRYDAIEEPVAATSVYRRLRQPIAVGASVLVATAVVYLGFIHSDEARVGIPVAVSGKVQTQNGKPSVGVARKRPDPELAQRPANIVAQRSAAVRSLPVAPPVGSPAAQRHAVVTAADVRRPTTTAPDARAVIATASNVTGTLAAAPDARGAVAVAPDARSAVVSASDTRRTAATTPDTRRTVAATPDARRTATLASDAGRGAGVQSASPASKLRADAARHLRAARVNLQENNLSATRSQLSAAVAAQPESRDAQRMRSALSTREEQRDALLSLARGCGYVGRWGCVSRNAGTALEIDASSKEAQRLVTLAMHESGLQIAPPPVEAAPEPTAPAPSDIITHH
ncbi:hypothetical protein I6I06_08695 [Paraburkholderia ginsengisoli]|uniref:Uncharacterized protein n=2 Tax=Paraburkholderia ginsengisoli TaxID=311231 RepID=A0A7T4T7I4_9BURK|nr:hypothetical protein I6I06_08695 [Paraburkholderia ginsengisoli]